MRIIIFYRFLQIKLLSFIVIEAVRFFYASVLHSEGRTELSMKKAKQITALVAIILLVGLYVATFIASFFSGFDSGTAFGVCLILTVAIPLLAFIAILFFGRAAGKRVIGDPEEIVIPEQEVSENDSDESDDTEITDAETTDADVSPEATSDESLETSSDEKSE